MAGNMVYSIQLQLRVDDSQLDATIAKLGTLKKAAKEINEKATAGYSKKKKLTDEELLLARRESGNSAIWRSGLTSALAGTCSNSDSGASRRRAGRTGWACSKSGSRPFRTASSTMFPLSPACGIIWSIWGKSLPH